jgi:hypothetical protein
MPQRVDFTEIQMMHFTQFILSCRRVKKHVVGGNRGSRPVVYRSAVGGLRDTKVPTLFVSVIFDVVRGGRASSTASITGYGSGCGPRVNRPPGISRPKTEI